MPDSTPQRIGKYEITDVLGQGAMGVVYRALDPMLNRYVAIKVMSQGIATDTELRDRFLREARAAGSLQHPNIITIYDFGETEGHLYIAMEYVEGSDLSEIMNRADPLPLQGKLGIVVDVLNALDYAHQRKVVHRDVKPANIRVSVDGRAKLMDFGIARLEKSELTRSGMMVGTPDYMAPEQITGGAITPATDVFAMGVVLYEFLTGVRTFDGETLHAVLYSVINQQPRPLREVATTIPPALQPILDKALTKDPAARYPSAGAMARELDMVRASLSAASSVTVVARRTPLAATKSTEMVAMTAIGELRPPRRRRPAVFAVVAAGLLVVAAMVVFVLTRHPAPAAETAMVSRVETPGAAAAEASEPVGAAREPGKAGAVGTGSTAAPERASGAVGTPSTAPDAPRQPPRRSGAASGRVSGASAPAEPRPAAEGAAAGDGAGRPAPTSVAAPTGAPQPAASPAGAAAVTPPTPTLPTSKPSAPAPSAAVAPARVAPAAPSAASPTPAAPAAPVDPRPAIDSLIGAYARAIEARSVDAIRRVYPALTTEQASDWQRFFQNVRDVKARLDIAQLDLEGPTARLSVRGTYDYRMGNASQHQPVSFEATAGMAGGVWKLTTVH